MCQYHISASSFDYDEKSAQANLCVCTHSFIYTLTENGCMDDV